MVSFKLLLNKISTHIKWCNILHFFIEQDGSPYGDRIPGVWLDSEARLFVSSSINGHKLSKLMDLEVVENKWYDFEISQLPDGYGKVIIVKLYLNFLSYHFYFQYVFSCKIDDTVYWKIENEKPRNFKDVIMYIGDPWYEAAQGLVQGLTVKSIDCGESCL